MVGNRNARYLDEAETGNSARDERLGVVNKQRRTHPDQPLCTILDEVPFHRASPPAREVDDGVMIGEIG